MPVKRSLPPPASPSKRTKLQSIEHFMQRPPSASTPKPATTPSTSPLAEPAAPPHSTLSHVLDDAGQDTYIAILSTALPTRTHPTALHAARAKITANTSLTPFRKLTLLLLSQVPHGEWTTYQCLADAAARITAPTGAPAKKGSARAIGSAMRNNPYAPVVPCHRVLASDGSIGGFAGEMTKKADRDGEKVLRKREMLREEGVRFESGGKVRGLPWMGFTAP